MRWERASLIIGGLVGLAVTPWFALSYYSAYGISIGETLPPWAGWLEWPVLLSADTAIGLYNLYGVVFGLSVAVVVVSLAVAVKRNTMQGPYQKQLFKVIAVGLGAVAVGSILEYGFGDFLDASWGFFLELLGFLAIIIGAGGLGMRLRRERAVSGPKSVALGISGLVAIVLGVFLIGHLPSGPALLPLLASVGFGFRRLHW